jgi:hypothetical protein
MWICTHPIIGFCMCESCEYSEGCTLWLPDVLQFSLSCSDGEMDLPALISFSKGPKSTTMKLITLYSLGLAPFASECQEMLAVMVSSISI